MCSGRLSLWGCGLVGVDFECRWVWGRGGERGIRARRFLMEGIKGVVHGRMCGMIVETSRG